MSAHPKISDEEMQYFQFKARQLYLLQKEDHDWNEFCKRKTCSCCSCLAVNNSKILKDVGIQASARSLPSGISRNTAAERSLQNSLIPQTLSEIKAKLDRIDLALTEMPSNGGTVFNQVLHSRLPASINTDEVVENDLKDKRMQIIQNSLKASLQRLQSVAGERGKHISSINAKKKSTGYFLPHDLQKQRVIARKAYLASLSKLENKTTVPHPDARIGSSSISKKDNHKQAGARPKTFLKTRKEQNTKPKVIDTNDANLVTCVESSEVKDENIENAVDGILDDLLGETVLTLNKVKQLKNKKCIISENKMDKCKLIWRPQSYNVQNADTQTSPDENEKIHSQTKGERIRQNLSHIKHRFDQENHKTVESFVSHPDESSIQSEIHKSRITGEPSDAIGTTSENTVLKLVKDSIPYSYMKTKLLIDAKIVKNISKHRKQYWKYLERISQTKKGNFNPWTLSNMVAESILEDCILDICQEIQDVPSSLIAELYHQEFMQDYLN